MNWRHDFLEIVSLFPSDFFISRPYTSNLVLVAVWSKDTCKFATNYPIDMWSLLLPLNLFGQKNIADAS